MVMMSRADLRSRVRNAAQSGAAQRAREQAGLTRDEAARRLKVDRITLYRWERGERVPTHGANLNAYVRFLERLGVDFQRAAETVQSKSS
jgi:transcriptional regulator with XRE-family HTH domain